MKKTAGLTGERRWIAFAGCVYVLAWIAGLAIGLATSAPGPTDSLQDFVGE